MVPEDTYKETRILAIRRGMDIGSLVDEALREKIVRDYQQMGLQPPFPQTQPQPQRPLQHNDPAIHSSRYEAAKSNGPITTQQSQPPQDPTATQLAKGLSSGVASIDKDLEVERSRALYLYDLAMKGQITKRGQEFIVPLPGIKFPANKDKMIEHLKKGEYPLKEYWRNLGPDRNKLIEELERNGTREKIINKGIERIRLLPYETYNNKSELEKDLRTIYRNERNDEKYEGRTIVIVDDTASEIKHVPT